MMEGWRKFKINELTDVITKGTTPSTYGYKFQESGINYIKAQSLSYEGSIDEEAFSFISEKAQKKLKRSQLKIGDILFSMAGAYLGMTGIVKESHCPANTNQAVGIIRLNNPLVNKNFVAYALRNPSTIAYVNAQSGQSAQPNINLREIGELEFSFPPLPEQKAISSILSAIDDKIELNLQMNKTLEDMAMALYKHWFVDFGPFRDGKFVESELDLIPEGWEVKGILEITKILSGGTPKTKISEYWNGEIDWVSAKDIGNGSVYINHTEKRITINGLENSSTKLLEEDTVILVARGSVGKYGMIAKPMTMNQSCYGLYTISSYSQGMVYLLFANLIKEFMSKAYGSVFDTITTSTFKSTNVIAPPDSVIIKLRDLVDPLFYKLKQNVIENQTLTQLRDTMLPKLISGEIRLKAFRNTIAKAL